MKKHIQTITKGPASNCYQTALACLLKVDPILVPNFGLFEEYLNDADVMEIVNSFLFSKFNTKMFYSSTLQNYHIKKDKEFPKSFKNKYYLLVGKFKLNPKIYHIAIYKNGKMVWDTFPGQPGLILDKDIECYYLV